jgi:apolipoprotein N-acyltransferase
LPCAEDLGKLRPLKLLLPPARIRFALAIVAGLLLAASMPTLSVAGMAWIAPGLMLLAAFGRRGMAAFRIGYVAGLAYYLASLSWLLLIPVTGYPILGWAALSAFLSLYPATWVWLCWKSFPATLAGGLGTERVPVAAEVTRRMAQDSASGFRLLTSAATYLHGLQALVAGVPMNLRGDFPPGGTPGSTAGGTPASTANWGEQFLAVNWSQRLIWSLAGAALWVALEMMVARFLGGFPWNLLGSSQYRIVPLIQIASFTGIYGVSFLVVWSSLSLLSAAMVVIRRPANRSAWVGEIILPMLAVSALYVTGYQKLLRPETPRPTLAVALVQPSIPQTLIWDPRENTNRFKQLLQLSEQALTNKADVLIWPEAALPKMLRYDEETLDAVAGLAREHTVWMIVGSDDLEPRRNAKRPNETDAFNSSFLVNPAGELVERYVKRNLVIFGEYIPLVRWLPFIKYLTPIDEGFTAGDRVVPFELKNLHVKVSVLICFEDEFPQLVREYVSDDTDFLVNITNDGWFREGSAQWQHAAGAIFRAVENGVPLVRCANDGLTCWIDSSGRLREFLDRKPGGIYGPGFLIAQIPVLLPGEKRAPTYYRVHGDVFGWGCVAFAALQVLRAWSTGRKKALA